MKTSGGTLLTTAYLLLALLISGGLAACGGGGSSSPGTSGPAVSVSIASATSYPAGTTFATSTASPATEAPPGNSPEFDNVFVSVTKIALIPSTGPEFPDAGGELESNSPDGGNGFVTATFSPVKIDLLNLSEDNAATLLNKFDSVPAGEYSKIRVYYDNVVGHKDGQSDTTFHQTAHYHFDVHFVGGNLVIPVTTEIHEQGGIRFYSVFIKLVGLKYHQAGQSGNILLRPQVFAEVTSAPEYIVSGVAQNVNPADNTFDIDTGGTIVTAVYGSTTWIYVDNTVVPVNRSSQVGTFLGASGLENGARVDAIGTFTSDNVLLAREVDVTFPDLLTGEVLLGWKVDNTFELRIPPPDNTVFPKPTRTTAYYDNGVDSTQLSDVNIVDNAAIIARGYKVAGGIKAYWISIGRLYIP